MEIKRYWNAPYDELIEAERKLYKDMYWLNRAKQYPIWKHLEPGAEQLNEAWDNAYFWKAPEKPVSVKIENEYPGVYEISLHVRHNEDFAEYCEKRKFKKNVQKLLSESKPKLLKKISESEKELKTLSISFRSELDNLKTDLKYHIKKNAVQVQDYQPFLSGSEEGRKTQKMIELIDNAVFTYRGVMCGSIYAYEWLLGNYIHDENVIDTLWNFTTQILESCKEYLAVQMAINHYEYAGNPTITDEEINWFSELLENLKKVKKDNDSVRKYFKERFPEFIGDPSRNYFRGGLNKTLLGESLSEIYEIKFKKKLGEKSFKGIFNSDLEKLRED